MTNSEVWWKKPDPVAIGTIVDKVLKDKNFINKKKDTRIDEIWEMVVDKKMLDHTRVDRLVKNKLYVVVDSPSYLFEFQSFYKKEILNKLKKHCNEIYVSDILLQIGDIRSE